MSRESDVELHKVRRGEFELSTQGHDCSLGFGFGVRDLFWEQPDGKCLEFRGRQVSLEVCRKLPQTASNERA